MELSLATIYGLILALGLVSVDTVMNANTLFLDSSVSGKFEDAGYSSTVVEQHLINELEIIADTRSLVEAPAVKSSDSPSFSAALASVVNLQASLEAAQQLVGFAPPKLYAAAVQKGGTDTIELTGRSQLFGRFSISVDGAERTVDEMIKEAAFRTFLELDPYSAMLHRFSQHEGDLTLVESELDAILERVRLSPHAEVRARLLNLKGIVALDRNDVDGAIALFHRALGDAPHFNVVRLNLALALVQLDRYQDAIDQTVMVTDPWYWPATTNPILLSTAYVLRGVARWGQGDLGAARADLDHALALQPKSTSALWYRAGLMETLGDPEKADELLAQATDSLAYFETYPEIALLYFWVSAEDMRPLERRTTTLPSWHDRAAPGGPSDSATVPEDKPAAAPAAPTPTQSDT